MQSVLSILLTIGIYLLDLIRFIAARTTFFKPTHFVNCEGADDNLGQKKACKGRDWKAVFLTLICSVDDDVFEDDIWDSGVLIHAPLGQLFQVNHCTHLDQVSCHCNDWEDQAQNGNSRFTANLNHTTAFNRAKRRASDKWRQQKEWHYGKNTKVCIADLPGNH